MQPLADIIVKNIDLSARGLNPAGLPVFRVVWAPSRMDRVLNKENSDMVTLPRYDDQGWVLEKWSTPEVYAGTKEAFEASVSASPVAMEYPSDGEYEACYAFGHEEEVEKAEFIAKVMNFDRENFTFADRRLALQMKAEMDAKEVDQKRDDIIDRAMSGSKIMDVTGRAYSLPN